MGRAIATAFVLAVAALAHVSAQSPQNAKPFLATQICDRASCLSLYSRSLHCHILCT